MAIGTTAALIGGGAILGAAGSVASGAMQSSAARSAAEAQLIAQREAIAAQREQSARAEAFMREQAEQARADLQPFRESQLRALGQLEGLADPGSNIYQQQRGAATTAIQRQLAAQGLLRSGRQTAALTDLELGLAMQRQQILGGLAGTGAGQAYAGIAGQLGGQLGANAINFGQQLGTSFQNMGAINANAITGQANAWGNALAGINNAAQGAAGQYVNWTLQNQLLQSLGGGGFGMSGGFGGTINPLFGQVA